MTRTVGELGLLAVGWVLLVVIQSQGLGQTELALVLGSVIMAEAVSSILVSIPRNITKSKHDALAQLLLGWIVVCLLLVLLFQVQLLTFYQGQPFAGLSLLALTLVLGLLKLVSAGRGLAGFLNSARLLVAAAISYAIFFVGGSGTDLSLEGLILGHLLVLLAVIVLPSRGTNYRSYDVPDAGEFAALTRHTDLLLVPLVLNGTDALLYFAARCLSDYVSAVLEQLGTNARSGLVSARQTGNHIAFVTMAARLNLGYLLIGGGVALAVLTAGPFLAEVIQQSEEAFQAVLIWLLLGTCAPVLFGATDILLCTTGKRAICRLVDLGTIILLCMAVFANAEPNPIFLAQCFAAFHLARAMLAAAILARGAGVWPGLTALMLRQIRLF